MTLGAEVVRGALATLADMVPPEQRATVAELQRRLHHGAFRVLVVGEAKRGKSTLVNALVGRPVLPSGVLPLTAVPTVVAYGDAEAVEVRYTDGSVDVLGLEALQGLVTEDGNPSNCRGVATVTLRLPAPVLAKGVELVDTPGTGSVYEHNTAATVAALEQMDAAIFVVAVDPPISATERRLLGQLRPRSVALFCVLNKVDYLSPEDLAAARSFTARVLATELQQEVTVWPVSARSALAARQCGDELAVEAAGLAAFEGALGDYLADQQGSDLVRSVAGRATEVARSVAEEAAVTLAGLELSVEDLHQRLAHFGDRLAEVELGRLESSALAGAEVDRLLGETNEQAAALIQTATPPIQRAVLAHLEGLRGPLREVEQQGLAFAAGRIRQVVDDWRTRQSGALDAAIQALDVRLTRRLEDHIVAVRRTAATLFELELVALRPTGKLVESTRFSYAFADEPGQAEAVAAAIRTHLPGALGRRRVTAHVVERSGLLLDRQIGRARADLQQRLAEVRRLLLRELDQRFDAGAGRIAEAVRRATVLQGDHSAVSAAARAELEERRTAASVLAERLGPGAAREVVAGA